MPLLSPSGEVGLPGVTAADAPPPVTDLVVLELEAGDPVAVHFPADERRALGGVRVVAAAAGDAGAAPVALVRHREAVPDVEDVEVLSAAPETRLLRGAVRQGLLVVALPAEAVGPGAEGEVLLQRIGAGEEALLL
jgi:hypothetical protein